MAIEYDLIMFRRTGPLSVNDVRAKLFAHLGVVTDDVDKRISVLYKDVLTVSVIATATDDMKALGFAYPGVNVGFRLYWLEADEPDPNVEMVRILDWLLHNVDADAHFSHDVAPDTAILFKSGKRIVALKDRDFWTTGAPSLPYLSPGYEYRKVSRGFRLDVKLRDPRVHPLTIRGALVAQFQFGLDPENINTAVADAFKVEVSRFTKDAATGELDEDPSGDWLSLYFYIDIFEYDRAIDGMLQVVRYVLQQKYAGDAKFDGFNGPPQLERTGSTLTLLDEPDFWTPARKALFEPKP
ncbi:hypothetical protein [Polyangium fumosum]|uniref:Uncharacterized protein n=1 Tax=Polyangium fumosum TaxID=889272 RepID=A0A4U1JB94_9BACT|nr:hypothetical protein [Polyangium fumosum]TKD06647.1 hypothetical protein E8A74_19280 [Polyangium fumosum]